MISLTDVTKTYQVGRDYELTAVRGVTLQVARGEFAVITGRSGSGKTTLLNLIAGIIRPSSGRICLDGEDVWALSDDRRSALRSHGIGFVFQFASLLPALTALENAALPAMFAARQPRAQVEARARSLLKMVGLGQRTWAHPRQLSAGEQQRVVIARALLNQPDLLLADEPTSDLDEQTEREIMELFARVHAETDITVMMVTHTSQLVAYGTRALTMAAGELHPQQGACARLDVLPSEARAESMSS